MKNIHERLTIEYNDNTLSDSLCDFGRDTETLTLLDSEYIYISHTCNIKYLFVALTEHNENQGNIVVESKKNDTWEVINALDDTKTFNRDGFITFTESVREIRISVTNATSELTFKTINILLSDDNDLIREYNPISNKEFKLGSDNFNLIHESVKEAIVQELRARTGLSNLTGFDLVEIQEVRLAATNYALSKIFDSVSDNKDDRWSDMSQQRFTKYTHYMNNAFVLLNQASVSAKTTTKIVRASR